LSEDEFPERLIGDKAYDSDPLDEELAAARIEMIAPHGQPFRQEPPVVNQSREPFASSFLFALRAGQVRPAAGLLAKNRRDEGRQGVKLTPLCPGQCRFDIVVDACQVRVFVHGGTGLSQVC
jgi:hypothetical protein